MALKVDELLKGMATASREQSGRIIQISTTIGRMNELS